MGAQRSSSGSDRESRRAPALRRRRDQRSDPARGGNEGVEDDRRDQQQRGGSDFPDRGLRAGGRSFQGAAGVARGGQGRQVEKTRVVWAAWEFPPASPPGSLHPAPALNLTV